MSMQDIKTLCRSLDAPDELRQVGRGTLALARIDNTVITKVTLQPGWRWSSDVKPQACTDSCMILHVQYVLSGSLRVIMEGGEEFDMNPGDAAVIPPGHDAYVLGDEPFVAIDFGGMANYGKGAPNPPRDR